MMTDRQIGNEASFDQLVNPLWSNEDSMSRIRQHRIKSVLDIGMGIGFTGMLLWKLYGIEHYVGLESCLEDECMNHGRDKPYDKAITKEQLFDMVESHDSNLFSDFLRIADLQWGINVCKPGFQWPTTHFDLIVMSNVVHYWHDGDAKRILELMSSLYPMSKVYIHLKDGCEWFSDVNIRPQSLIALCNEIADKYGWKYFGPFKPLETPGDMGKDEGYHHTWTNL
jgi:SAM-dependent methyltransferase